MKQPEYIEGKHALENFEEGMKALFKAPKAKVAYGLEEEAETRFRDTQAEEAKADKD